MIPAEVLLLFAFTVGSILATMATVLVLVFLIFFISIHVTLYGQQVRFACLVRDYLSEVHPVWRSFDELAFETLIPEQFLIGALVMLRREGRLEMQPRSMVVNMREGRELERNKLLYRALVPSRHPHTVNLGAEIELEFRYGERPQGQKRREEMSLSAKRLEPVPVIRALTLKEAD